METATQTSILLICTVGGSPEPIIAALKHWQPMRIYFVHTKQTKDEVAKNIIPKAREQEVDLDAGRYDLFELSDEQSLESCLDQMRQLAPKVEEWVARGAGFQVVVDFTGGTKCMSAAIGIQASRWPCVFSYVGGNDRTKGGVGVVVSGSEKIIHQTNPWDALGYQAVEEFVLLFNQRAFLAAAKLASVVKARVSRVEGKSEFAVLERLAEALDAWDRFDHKKSKNLLDGITPSANNLRAVLGPSRGDRVLDGAAQLASHLDDLIQATPPSRYHVLDLLANAKRRKEEGRFDDAVARLYRAIEAIAQGALKARHNIESTEKVPFERIPEALRAEWASQEKEGVIKLGLQNAYALLAELKDPTGAKFQAKLTGPKSPLVARNRSILAHGFTPVSKADVESLWAAVLSFADIDAASLPSFPKLSETEGKA